MGCRLSEPQAGGEGKTSVAGFVKSGEILQLQEFPQLTVTEIPLSLRSTINS